MIATAPARNWLDDLTSLPPDERAEWIQSLTEEQASAALHDWRLWARPDQIIEPGDWRVWMIIAGRGYGKTRAGAEWTREQARHYPLVNIIGATADDARDIMIEGESGILNICPGSERPQYLVSKRRLEWPNGAQTLIFTADEPERLRGKQHMKLWADEVGAWRYPESFDQAMFGLRLGDNPQVVVTTTPRPTPLIRDLLKRSGTVVRRGTTYDNRDNLAEAFYTDIIRKYEGTRLGRQELLAEILLDTPGSLWTRDMIRYKSVQ
jgi:phage terminase large subunit-like protein